MKKIKIFIEKNIKKIIKKINVQTAVRGFLKNRVTGCSALIGCCKTYKGPRVSSWGDLTNK